MAQLTTWTFKNAIKARAEAHTKELKQPATLKRKTGYHDDNAENKEDLSDATRMKVDQQV